jgi:hypothetical protein
MTLGSYRHHFAPIPTAWKPRADPFPLSVFGLWLRSPLYTTSLYSPSIDNMDRIMSSKALAAEVRILLQEVGKLRDEKRALQYEVSELLAAKVNHPKLFPNTHF